MGEPGWSAAKVSEFRARGRSGPEVAADARADHPTAPLPAGTVTFLLTDIEGSTRACGWASLIPTELEVVAAAMTGLTNTEIGARMFISPMTVKTHLARIYAKLGLANRAALAAEATARGIMPR